MRGEPFFAIIFYRSRRVKFKINIPNGWWCMPPRPVPADPGWDDDPARCVPEPEGPWWEDEEYPDPEDELTAEELAEIREDAGAARHLHRTDLPSAFHSGGLRAQHSV